MVLQHCDVKHGKLAVEIKGNGPLVLCAPAMGDLRSAYAPLSSQLAANGFTVAVMDIRGHGDSSTDFQKYGDEAIATDFIALIETLNKGPVVLAGASLSAGGAAIAAGRRPDLVRGLILIGPFLRNPQGVMGIIGPTLMKTLVMKPWGPSVWKSYSKTLWPGLGDEGATKRAADNMDSLTRPKRWAAFQATVKGADHSTVTPYLSKIKNVPALVVMGEKDPDWSKPVEEAEWVASNFRDSRLLAVPGAGHAPHLESPEMVGKEVLQFLKKLDG
ncbi:hypothetical protein M409DRAFT_28185 [Zasmidium cellare ATCC 36951]|uniref:AB hydrolase-1 domain-containing protein n=1 Tax=Zasmidium cellare ATCC 36951 TaxID=1080233 RepID=A0A6A6C370_ZASCE|nr:uncharacterized protein M409DRAFT_28185 [Zasmidium cellare ATCC 36951]KAF2161455.1 hypothetical protein M409DRAFT_28185 [Zasmidium cellare ATCC 36951]